MNTSGRSTCAVYAVISCLLWFIGLGLSACNSSDSGGTTGSSATATITGTVSGTIIKVLHAGTNAVLAQTDTASQSGQTPFAFSLANVPAGVPLRVFFFSGGQTFALLVGSPATNVFTIANSGSLDLGFVTMSAGSAIPANQPPAGSVSFGSADLSVPPGVQPPPATVTVATPAPATGSVVVNFTVANFAIGGQGQQHLHVRVDGGSTRHFFNGSSNKVVDGSGNLTTDVQWQNASSFRINNLLVGIHQITVRLATASDVEFVNAQALPPDVSVTINSPPSPVPTLTITSPSAGASLPQGPVTVSFDVENFTVGSQGTSHLHINLDSGPAAHFYNGSTNQVLDDGGQPAPGITRLGPTSFQFSGLSAGAHQARLVLVDSAEQELQNAEARPPILNISIQSSTPTIAVTSATTFLSSPVRITFTLSNFTIGLPGTPHMRLSIDGGPQNDYYNGPGITSDNGVLLNGVHNHAVHWTSPSSFDLFGLTAASHSVRLALVDAGDTEVASTTTNFIVQQPPSGELQLQSVLDGLVFPSALVQANDGRVFFNERLTGNVRVVNISGPTWQLDPTPFCPALSISAAGEQGLLGLALDPDFSSNQSLYVFYTRAGFWNRVSRLTQSGSGCSETVILDGLPTAGIHNGGIIRFGPDGKLYVITGDAGNPNDSQNVNLLAGKVLRVNPDGTAPPDNPFYLDGSGNRDKVYSLGHRNSFGFTFHAQTGDLWESENGSSDFDEVNRVVSGGNYGWDSTEQSGFLNRPCCRNPILALPIIAPTGIVTVPGNSSIYSPIYRNNLLMASFNDGAIRLVIPNPSNPDQPGTTSVAFGGGQGGLVGIMLGNDGYVYVTNHNFSTFNGSSIFRVIPH